MTNNRISNEKGQVGEDLALCLCGGYCDGIGDPNGATWLLGLSLLPISSSASEAAVQLHLSLNDRGWVMKELSVIESRQSRETMGEMLHEGDE